MSQFRQFSFKKFGYFDFNMDIREHLSLQDFDGFIKIVFLEKGGHAVIDFNQYHCKGDVLFFLNPGQHYSFDETSRGTMIYYNRDFYCVEIHDKEVACDGILFHNIYDIPMVHLTGGISADIQILVKEIKREIEFDDISMEEMLRILLKQIIIKSTRIWKQDHMLSSLVQPPEIEFLRAFSQLIEWNYTKYHSVAGYAELLHISPIALNKRITRYTNSAPNDLIKKRIILEAKRLLAHTRLSVKEIGYKLGYEDISYFIRLFTKQVMITPQNFRLQYQNS